MKQSGYLKRMQAAQRNTIIAHREEAAKNALCVMLCTLADEYGFGYRRLNKLAQETMKNIHDLYTGDIDMEVEHVKQRLRQLGFRVDADGTIYGEKVEDEVPLEKD